MPTSGKATPRHIIGRVVQTCTTLVVLTAFLSASKKPVAEISVDLTPYGLQDLPLGHHKCAYLYNDARSVLWLDPNHIVTAFGANPRCSNEIEKPFDGPLRIIAFDLTGKKLTSVDIPFQSDNQQAGKYLYNGPDGHLVVYTTLSVGRNELTMLSGTDLTTLQKLEFEGSVTPTGDGQRHWVSAPGFEGTTAEHHWIVFRHFPPYTRLGDHSGLYYTFYSGTPLATTGRLTTDPGTEICSHAGEQEVAMINCKQDGWGTVRVRTADGSTWSYHDVPTRHIRFHGWLPAGALLMAAGNGDGGNAPFTLHSGGTRHDLPVMPRPFWVEDVLGYSNDGSRLAVLGVHWSYFCEDFEDITGIRPPFGCKERFMLVVFDSAKKKIISQRPLKNGASWGVLSPDGKRLAIFENHTLFIYRLP